MHGERRRVETSVTVAVGIRPEDIVVSGDGALAATVSVVEYQGREFAVEAVTDRGLRLHVRTQTRLAPGEAVRLHLPAQRLLVFPGGDELPRARHELIG